MRFLTHADKFKCIHQFVIVPQLVPASERLKVGGQRILLEEEILNSAGWCTPPSGPPCIVTNVMFSSPDKLQITGKRPLIEGVKVLTTNGLAVHEPPISPQNHSISLKPMPAGSRRSSSEILAAEEPKPKKYRLKVKCCVNAKPLTGKPFRLYLSGGRPAIAGKTDGGGIVDTLVDIKSSVDCVAFLEVDIEGQSVVLYRLLLTFNQLQNPVLVCNNLGLRCFSRAQRDALRKMLEQDSDWIATHEQVLLKQLD